MINVRPAELIPDVKIITPQVFQDNRGYFLETWKETENQAFGGVKFVQENQSFSVKGTFRGIHFQRDPYAQGKLVTVIYGSVFDYAVDLRRKSPTYLKWTAINLTGENHFQFYLPPGFGHAFLALEDSLFSYKCTNYYNKESEGGIRYDDPVINLRLDITGMSKDELILSEKDIALPYSDEI